ncbi:MAG: GAF and ANTAR domain-containing protein [Jatrophihabitans sp.]
MNGSGPQHRGNGARHRANGAQPGAALIGRICDACVRSLPVAGAAVSVLTSEGHRGTIHATDTVVAALEDLHFGLGEGPGVDALRDRHPVLVEDLADPDPDQGPARRWPAFTPDAIGAGARAVFVFPLVLGAAVIGALVLYNAVPTTLDGDQRARALRLADAAMFGLLDLGGGLTAWTDGLPDVEMLGLGQGLHRAEVYQAAGMLTVQLDVDITEAMVRLRGYAFARERSILDVARDIVNRDLQLGHDNG